MAAGAHARPRLPSQDAAADGLDHRLRHAGCRRRPGTSSSRVSTRSLHVYRDGRRVKTFKVIVGKPSTPTPRGEFFIEETMRLPRKHVGYPFALATSARSRGVQGVHGRPRPDRLPRHREHPGGKMGTAVSNGCIRMTTAALMWLAPAHQGGRAAHDPLVAGRRPPAGGRAQNIRPVVEEEAQPADDCNEMLLFIVIALSVVWLSGCVLALALGAMLARADGREPARPARTRRPRRDALRRRGRARRLPTA